MDLWKKRLIIAKKKVERANEYIAKFEDERDERAGQVRYSYNKCVFTRRASL